MLLVAAPMRNTEYSSSWVEPVRAPTMRSVPETADEKLARRSVRSRSMPISSSVASAMLATVSIKVKRRFQALRAARLINGVMRKPPSWRPPAPRRG